jgi:hypothetical protein
MNSWKPKMTDELSDVDRDALTRAMEITMREPDRAGQLTAKLEDEPWVEVAKFAAYHCQTKFMRLRPWDAAPCHALMDEGGGRITRNSKAGAVMDRLLDAGLSQWEPDPMAALAEALGSGSKRKATKR